MDDPGVPPLAAQNPGKIFRWELHSHRYEGAEKRRPWGGHGKIMFKYIAVVRY